MTNPYARPEHPDSPQQGDSPPEPGPPASGAAGRPDPWSSGYDAGASQYGGGAASNYSNPTVGMPQPAPSPIRPDLPPAAPAEPAPVYEQPPLGYSPYGQPQDPGPLLPASPALGHPTVARPLPEHPNSVPTLVLGIVGFIFPLTFPVAWYLGAKGSKQTRNNPGRWRSSPMMTVGMVLGIVGTILMVLGIAAFTLFILLLVAAA